MTCRFFQRVGRKYHAATYIQPWKDNSLPTRWLAQTTSVLLLSISLQLIGPPLATAWLSQPNSVSRQVEADSKHWASSVNGSVFEGNISIENVSFAPVKVDKNQTSALRTLLKLGLPTCKKFAHKDPGYPQCSGKPQGKISGIDKRYGQVTSPSGDAYAGSIYRRNGTSSIDWKLVYAIGGGLNPCSYQSAKSKIPISVLAEFHACFQEAKTASPVRTLTATTPATLANLLGQWRMHAGGLVVNNNATGEFAYPREDPTTYQNNFYDLKFKIVSEVGGLANGLILTSNDPLAPQGSAIKLQRTGIGVTVIFPSGDTLPLCDKTNWLQGACGV